MKTSFLEHSNIECYFYVFVWEGTIKYSTIELVDWNTFYDYGNW